MKTCLSIDGSLPQAIGRDVRKTESGGCLCSFTSTSSLVLQHDRKIVRCQECHLFARAQMPSEEEVLQAYRDEYLTQFRNEQIGDARSNVYAHALRELAMIQPQQGRLVDVGWVTDVWIYGVLRRNYA